MILVNFALFTKCFNEFFQKEFPSDVLKVTALTKAASANRFSIKSPGTGSTGGSGSQSFTDEFKVSATRDLSSAQLNTEIKSTTNFALLPQKLFAKSVTTLETPNQLSQQIVITNSLLEGLKLDVSGSLQPDGSNSAKATIDFNQGIVVSSTTVDLSPVCCHLNSKSNDKAKAMEFPGVTTSLAARLYDMQVGGEVSFDVKAKAVEQYSLGLSLDRPREKILLVANNGLQSFTGSYLQRFSDQLEVACRGTWSPKLPTMSMELGAKWYLNTSALSNITGSRIGASFIKAKVDNQGRLAMSLSNDVRPGVQLLLGATVDTAKLGRSSLTPEEQRSCHKIGMELHYAL